MGAKCHFLIIKSRLFATKSFWDVKGNVWATKSFFWAPISFLVPKSLAVLYKIISCLTLFVIWTFDGPNSILFPWFSVSRHPGIETQVVKASEWRNEWFPRFLQTVCQKSSFFDEIWWKLEEGSDEAKGALSRSIRTSIPVRLPVPTNLKLVKKWLI